MKNFKFKIINRAKLKTFLSVLHADVSITNIPVTMEYPLPQ